MQIIKTSMPDVYLIELEKLEDNRGFFARTWCEREFAAVGLRDRMVQDSIAYNTKKGTLRGLHYHKAPSTQARIIRCIAGSIFVAIVDLRANSTSYLQVLTDEITQDNFKAYYLPPGFALGYQTLQDNSIVYYQMPEFYDPSLEAGYRWDEPVFGIRWPLEVSVMSERDRNYEDMNNASYK